MRVAARLALGLLLLAGSARADEEPRAAIVEFTRKAKSFGARTSADRRIGDEVGTLRAWLAEAQRHLNDDDAARRDRALERVRAQADLIEALIRRAEAEALAEEARRKATEIEERAARARRHAVELEQTRRRLEREATDEAPTP